MQHERPSSNTSTENPDATPWSESYKFFSPYNYIRSDEEPSSDETTSQSADVPDEKDYSYERSSDAPIKLSDYKDVKLSFDFNERLQKVKDNIDDYEMWYDENSIAISPLFITLQTLSKKELLALFANSNPIQQLHYLSAFLHYYEWNHSQSLTNRNDQVIYPAIANDESVTPLVKIVSDYTADIITNLKQSFYDPFDPSADEDLAYYEEKQEQLKKKYPNIINDEHPQYTSIKTIAPGIAAGFDFNTSDEPAIIETSRHEVIDLSNLDENNPLGLTKESASLIKAIHTGETEYICEAELGIELSKIGLFAQCNLFNFMTKPNTMSRFERLRSTMKKSNKSLRIKLLKNFTAVQSGDDFGDALLDIGESKTINDEQKEKILDTIESCRKSILSITKLYQKNDAQFKREYTIAANERLTDALTVFSEIAKNGYAEADLDWAGTPALNYDSAIEALEYEANSLKIIAGTIQDVQDGKEGAFAERILKPNPADQRLNRSLYNLYSPDYGYIQIYTRPEGSHSFDPTLEYGKARNKYDENATNTGVEASISMMTNPVDPFAIPNPFRPNRHGLKDPNFYDKSTMDKVSAIRLDREGRAPGLSADDERRDPTNYIGTISVDLAAIGDREDTPSGKIARLLAVGNAIRSKERKTETSLNHNTNHFNQEKYGIASGFSGLVHSLDTLLTNLVKEHPPKDDKGLTNTLKRASRKTGRVAIGSAAISEAS